MAQLSVPDVFAPDDQVALFCVSMAMAANDVEYALRQVILANSDGANEEERERARFSQKVRLTYGFLFEGIEALKAWRRQEPAVAKLLRELPKDGAKLLKEVCGLEQQIGAETIAHVRHNTFHYPHPDPGRAERSKSQVKELGEIIAGLHDRPATVAMSEEAQHTFPFADQVALRLALLRHDENAQAPVRDGAVAFVNLVRHIHMRFCEKRGIIFELVGEGPADFQILIHQRAA